ncbi:pyrroline-5-carboxylate reductase [Schnuerera sp. xch1]|uniref:pyrroline-5-carboxylate reductase n=1 Tax=Schnuerera sp. xch1 TaxID=2874283 RepID=UPI001CBF17EE|nr:pyrroline-5-carboxylate reductase [Schnuerera sp. xch1]MBZ2175858.1 pyrroline-5-carboxylate reductase [Schnuerera sp. xch1]
MDKTIGFIGCGNMAKAMINGIIKSNLIENKKIIVSATTEATLKEVSTKYSIKTTISNIEVVSIADILILAVKPDKYDLVIDEIKEYIKKDSIVVGIAAGINIGYMQNRFNKKVKIVKAMPNTPAMVGQGMTAISSSKEVGKDELQQVINIFNSFGKSEVIEESLMDAVTAVSGSSPAYVYMMIEAMADAAVVEGMSRKTAYKFASQTVLGAAKMILDTEMHPGELKDRVCSPSGTTIEAVAALEENGFRSSIIEAMRVCAAKSKEMTK